jgi:hypothetical protein
MMSRSLGSLRVPPAYRTRICATIFCVSTIAWPALCQQSEVSTSVAPPDASAETIAQNAGPGEAGVSQEQGQSGSMLPNAPSAYAKPAAATSSLTLNDRFRIYKHALSRPYMIVGPAMGAGIGQWENEPPEWGQGGQGYGRRLASGVSRSVISETIRFGFAAADGEDPRFKPSGETGVCTARHSSRTPGIPSRDRLQDTPCDEAQRRLPPAWGSISLRNLSHASTLWPFISGIDCMALPAGSRYEFGVGECTRRG